MTGRRIRPMWGTAIRRIGWGMAGATEDRGRPGATYV
jgi:hypothetical protein